MWFLNFVILAQGIKIKEKRIKVMKTWLSFSQSDIFIYYSNLQTFTKSSIETWIELQYYLLQYLKQPINQLAKLQNIWIKKKDVLSDANSASKTGRDNENLSNIKKVKRQFFWNRFSYFQN